jgi:hypothetical protein
LQTTCSNPAARLKTGYTDGKATLAVYPTGAINYEKQGSFSPFLSSEEQAKAIAADFVQQNGGMPADAYLAEVQPQYTQDANTGEQTVYGYLITYKHGYEGTQIAGVAGDKIQVLVDNSGVSYFVRAWKEVVGKETGTEKLTITAEEAIAKAKPHMESRFKTKDVPAVESAELIYWSKPFNVEQTTLVPAWKVSVGTHEVYVDAFTGEYLKETDETK